MNDYILFKDIDGKYTTLPELLVAEEKKEDAETSDENASKDQEAGNEDGTSKEAEDGDQKDAEPKDTRKPIYYVTDMQQQSQYINMFRQQGMNAVVLDHTIDSSFITQLEQRNQNYKFLRIDADVTDSLVEETSEEELKESTDTLTGIFRKALGKDKLNVKVEKFKDKEISSVITLPEESRRMQDMMKMYNMYGMDPSMFGGDETLVLNANNDLVQYILNHGDGEHTDLFCKQLYDLAMISNQPLSPEEMTAFVNRSNQIMMLLAKE